MITSDGGIRDLEARIFVDNPMSAKVLRETQLPSTSLLVPGYGGEAYSLISECNGQIVTAILSCYEDPSRVATIHRALRSNNTNLHIYHQIPQMYIEGIQDVLKAGLIELKVEGVLPYTFSGNVHDNPLYKLGQELNRKYFM